MIKIGNLRSNLEKLDVKAKILPRKERMYLQIKISKGTTLGRVCPLESKHFTQVSC